MSKKLLLFIASAFLAVVIISAPFHEVNSNAVGAPSGNTGSPADSKTCARSGCHPGTATAIADAITSDVPLTGYVPGQTYTVTATVSDPNLVKFGFEISPQSLTGTLLGTILLTDAARTKFTGTGGKYITHTSAGTSATNHTNTWSFNWTAPVSGTGAVTFYGAFNFSNNNGNTSGDVIHTSTLSVAEAIASGIDEVSNPLSLRVYPNPVTDHFNVSYSLAEPQQVIISLFDLTGKVAAVLQNENLGTGPYQKNFSLPDGMAPGLYLLRVDAGNSSFCKKIIKN
jgi:hypothetical protein